MWLEKMDIFCGLLMSSKTESIILEHSLLSSKKGTFSLLFPLEHIDPIFLSPFQKMCEI